MKHPLTRARGRLRAISSALALALAACSDPTELVLPIAEDGDSGRVRVVIPEVWELANVILAVTTYGSTDPTLILRQGPYYADVRSWFDRWRTHDSMDELQLDGGDPLRRMYEFRENSIAYGYLDGSIVRGQRYPLAIWSPNLFRERLED